MQQPGPATPSLFGELRQRRVLPLLGGYVAAMWLLIELLGFATERYGIDPRWVDLMFGLTWLMLPGALLMIWRIGPLGDAVWQRRDAWLLGLNALLALAGGAAIWMTQAGETPQAVVPDAPIEGKAALEPALGNRVLMLPLQAWDDAGSLDPADGPEPLALAVPALAGIDLMFDERIAFLTLGNGHLPGARGLLEKLQARSLSRLPLTTHRHVAETYRCSGLIQARYRELGDGKLEVEITYLALSPQRQLETERLDGLDAWDVAEHIAAGVRRHFARGEPIDLEHDPALRAVSSDSLPAVLAFARGAFDIYYAQQPESGLAHLRRAIEIDPQFSTALVTYAYATPALMDAAVTREALQQAVLRSAALPESVRFSVQTRALLANGEIERAREVYRLWSQRRPFDPTPAYWLAEDKLREDPFNETALLRLQELLMDKPDAAKRQALADRWYRVGRFEQALALLELPGTNPVEDYSAALRIAQVMASMGDTEQALQRLRTAEALRPDAIQPILSRAQLLFAQDRSTEALATLNEATARAGSDAERAAVLGFRIPLLNELGRSEEIPELLSRHERLLRASAYPGQVLHGHHIALFEAHAEAHGPEATMRWFEAELAAVPEASRFRYQATLMTMAGSLNGDLALLERGLRDLEASEQPDPTQAARLWRASLEARRASLSGDRELALQRYAEALQWERLEWASGRSSRRFTPRLTMQAIDAAVLAGMPEAAEDWAEALKTETPGYPRSALTLGRWHLALGEAEQAAAWLERAERNLQDATPGHELLVEVGRLRQALAESAAMAPET